MVGQSRLSYQLAFGYDSLSRDMRSAHRGGIHLDFRDDNPYRGQIERQLSCEDENLQNLVPRSHVRLQWVRPTHVQGHDGDQRFFVHRQ